MQVGVGLTRDVVLVQGTVEVLPTISDAARRRVRRQEPASTRAPWPTAYPYFRLTPRSIQVWREEDELAGRWVMRARRALGSASALPAFQ